METKWFATSTTVIGLVLTALVTFAPMIGLSFSADDAQLVSANIDKVLQGVFLLVSMWGRIRAAQPLSLMPKA